VAKKSSAGGEAVNPAGGEINFEVLFPVWQERLDKLGKEHGTPSDTEWAGSVMEKPDAAVFTELLALGKEMDAAYLGKVQPGTDTPERIQYQATFLHEWMRLSYAAAQGVNNEELWDKMQPEQGREVAALMVSLARHFTKFGAKHVVCLHAQELLIALFLAFPGDELQKLISEHAQQSKNKSIQLFVEGTLKRYKEFMAPASAEAWKAFQKLSASKGVPPPEWGPEKVKLLLDCYEANKEFFERINAKQEKGEPLTEEEEEKSTQILNALLGTDL
jgi:hypothetical protein